MSSTATTAAAAVLVLLAGCSSTSDEGGARAAPTTPAADAQWCAVMARLDDAGAGPPTQLYRELVDAASDGIAGETAAAVELLTAEGRPEPDPELERHLDAVFSYRAARCRDGRPATPQAALDDVAAEERIEGASVTIVEADGDAVSLHSGRIHEPAPIASVSKTFTAALALRLAEQGRVDLDVPVALDGLPAGVTMRHLLGHTAGLPYSADVPPAGAETCAVGACFAYSDLGYRIAGSALESATGISYAQLVSDELLVPAGLSSMHLGSDAKIDPLLVQTGAAGALVASSEDLARFGAALADGDIVSGASLDEMLDTSVSSALPCPDPGRCLQPYGLGLERLDTPYGPAFGHRGSTGAVLRHYSDRGVTVAVVTTEPGSGTRILDEVLGAAFAD
jgi:D-alanyl-D-alanine carboxypeptidase